MTGPRGGAGAITGARAGRSAGRGKIVLVQVRRVAAPPRARTSQRRSSAVRPRPIRQSARPIAAAMAMSAIRNGATMPLNRRGRPGPSRSGRPERGRSRRPSRPGSPLTAPPANRPAAPPIRAMPSDGDDQRAQPAARLGAAREPRPITRITGSSSPTGGPSNVSRRSEVQAPGLPIQLRTGPAASVFSEGSLG